MRILGISWLLEGDRRGQVASPLVIYMRDLRDICVFPLTKYFYFILFPPADFILGCWVGEIVGIGFSFWGVSGLVRRYGARNGPGVG